MGFTLGLGHRLEHRIEQRLETRLSLAQRVEIASILCLRHLELVQTLRGQSYEPGGECPRCGTRPTAGEIILGFSRDPKDFTTKCPRCRTRFEARLICSGNGSKIQVTFYCPSQVLDQLRGLERITPEQISHDHPGVYQSALAHHGSLTAAFGLVGLDYALEKPVSWKEKVAPFLGLLPDSAIARAANAPVSAVRAIRRAQGIDRYVQRDDA